MKSEFKIEAKREITCLGIGVAIGTVILFALALLKDPHTDKNVVECIQPTTVGDIDE